MFPLNDYGVVCAALATFSAALGYKYSQRRNHRRPRQQRGRSASWASGSLLAARRYLPRRYSSVSSVSTTTLVDGESVDGYPSDPPSPSDFASDETEPGSLKRKHRDTIYDNSIGAEKITRDASLPPPQKRCRSSSPILKEEEVTLNGEQHSVASPNFATPPPLTPEAVVPEIGSPAPVCAIHAPQSFAPTLLSIPKVEPQDFILASPVVSPSKLESTFTIPACKPSTAFSAFAGTSTAFSSTFTTSNILRPAWCTVESPAAPITSIIDTSDVISVSLGAQKQIRTVTTPVSTGEEEEDVESELKGVKLFIKHGSKEFTDGMLGHVKFLSNKETREERLVFRREPVWKVSMNVRLRPVLRCTFDEELGVLRLTLKEKNEDAENELPDNTGESVVIYALRRGKVSKSDFADFAKGVVKSSHLIAPPLDRI